MPPTSDTLIHTISFLYNRVSHFHRLYTDPSASGNENAVSLISVWLNVHSRHPLHQFVLHHSNTVHTVAQFDRYGCGLGWVASLRLSPANPSVTQSPNGYVALPIIDCPNRSNRSVSDKIALYSMQANFTDYCLIDAKHKHNYG